MSGSSDLERRPANASLMPGMFELPPLPEDAVQGREPLLRLRHSITNTNYYVRVFRSEATTCQRQSDARHVRAAATARRRRAGTRTSAPPAPFDHQYELLCPGL